MKIFLAAGGTAGHIFPAVALSHELLSRNVECALIGAQNGMEERLCKEHKLEFFGVRAGKLDRTRPNPKALWNATMGFFDAISIVRHHKPNMVVGFGGFASFPGVAAAALTNTPFALHEANAYPGLVTRLFAPRAKLVALADESTRIYLKSIPTPLVGMPVREQRFSKTEAANKFTVLVMGGSQGSVRLNALLPPILEMALAGKNAQVLHQTGKGRLHEVVPRVAHLPWYHCAEFVDGSAAFGASDFAITRAGMSTIADAAFHAVPLAAVPLPSSAEDHQRKNALALEQRGAGLCVLESELETTPLDGKLISGMLSCLNPTKLAQWRALVQHHSPQGAAKRMADVVLEAI
jgi:UDP-N-acetylglucosamine--N-acetylmuramyl-(pentapeptide) pyrophosphoryl-undecaprenol N-acetylglucosamine transferase